MCSCLSVLAKQNRPSRHSVLRKHCSSHSCTSMVKLLLMPERVLISRPQFSNSFLQPQDSLFLVHLTSIRSLPPALSLITFDLKHLFCFTNQAGTAFEIRLLLTTLNCSFRNYVSPSQQAVIACVWGTPLHPFKQTNRTLVCLCVFSHNHIFIGQYL